MELKLDNKYLETECEPFDFSNPPVDPIELSNSMTQFMHNNGGAGLAANQVGLPYRVIVMRGLETALFNPKLLATSEETSLLSEGCLSFPNLIVKIKRPKSIRVRYTDAFGKTDTRTFVEMTARTFCHELDHLDGIVFYKRANKYHRDLAFRQWRRETKIYR